MSIARFSTSVNSGSHGKGSWRGRVKGRERPSVRPKRPHFPSVLVTPQPLHQDLALTWEHFTAAHLSDCFFLNSPVQIHLPKKASRKKNGNAMPAATRRAAKQPTLLFPPCLQETWLQLSGSLTEKPPEKIWVREIPGPGGQILGGPREVESASDKHFVSQNQIWIRWELCRFAHNQQCF